MSAIEEFFAELGDGPCWVTGKTLKSFVAALRKDRARLMGGGGDEVATEQGRFFNIRGGRGGGSDQGPTVLRKVGNEWKVGVSGGYCLCDFIKFGFAPVRIDVEDRLTAGGDDDPGWRATAAGDQVWIEFTVTALVADSAYVLNKTSGGAVGGGEVENGGAGNAIQTKGRIFLADVESDGSGGLRLVHRAGWHHRLGIGIGDSADSGGGTQAAIRAILAIGF